MQRANAVGDMTHGLRNLEDTSKVKAIAVTLLSLRHKHISLNHLGTALGAGFVWGRND